MKFSRSIICLVSILASVNAISQHLPEDIKSWLSSNELSRIRKAEIRIDQGEQILFSRQLKQIKDSIPEEESDYLSLSNGLMINKKTSRLLLETKEYFASGYESKLEIYKPYLDHYLKIDTLNKLPISHALNDSIDIYLSDARFFRDKSEIKGNLIAAANAVHQSNINLQSAVILCEKALVLIKNGENTNSEDQTTTKELVIQQLPETKNINKTDTPKKEETLIVNTKTKQKEVVSEKKTHQTSALDKTDESSNNKPIDDVYFTVQILADKKPVSELRIKKVYNGSLKIIENQGDGWYRYSFGKFNNYTSAKKALLNSNIKGYVVAYKNKTRISVREAINYLQKINQ